MTVRQSSSQAGIDMLLRRLSAVSALSAGVPECAARAFQMGRAVPARDLIVRDGNRENLVKVLVSGFACRYIYLPAGRRQITAFILPGDLCDFGFLAASPASQGAVALAPSVVMVAELDRFASLVEQQPDVMTAVLRCAAIDQRATQERLASLGGRNALHRVGHLLCELHFRLDQVGLVREGNVFELPLTQSELGEALGLSTVHVNRTIQTLRKLGLAIWRERLVTLPHPEALASLCSFDPGYLEMPRD